MLGFIETNFYVKHADDASILFGTLLVRKREVVVRATECWTWMYGCQSHIFFVASLELKLRPPTKALFRSITGRVYVYNWR